ncbi:discriminator of mRNA degradation [Escherichia phage vB_EcoM-172859UKE1]|nr:discriminator of mRNA degradation [Escherichia phage vB_EcoM-172859UKE1]
MSKLTKVTFIGWFKNDNMFTKDIMLSGDREEIEWVAVQLAEVNSALVKAFLNDEKVFEADFR